MLTTVLILYIIHLQLLACCRIDHPLHGTFQRQFGEIIGNDQNPPQYEKVTLSSSSSNIWGDCYEKSNSDSFIFGLKRMGRPTCFRCITLILRSQNIIQVLHQQESICHENVSEARRSCFDVSSISPGDGSFLFRSKNVVPDSCGLEGRFQTSFSRKNTNIKCSIDSGTQMENCNLDMNFKISFKNCSFPDFSQNLVCLGFWPGLNSEKYAILMDKDTGHYKCGILTVFKEKTRLSLTSSSSCMELHGSKNNAFEEYTFIEAPKNIKFLPCRFPEWLQGEYEGLTVKNDTMKYHLPNSPSITSLCAEVDNERILVHSEASCGETLGYHCLWFRSRSNSVVEFKTTEITTEDIGMCRKESEFEKNTWTTLISASPQKQACAFFGSYSTPKDMKLNQCFNLTVDCKSRDRFKLVAYHCESGIAYDVKNYNCYGTWKESDNLYVYTKTEDSKTNNVCFISRQQGDLLYMAILGSHCSRRFNFSENTDSILVLQRTDDCSRKKPTTPMPKKTTSSVVRYAPPSKSIQFIPGDSEKLYVPNTPFPNTSPKIYPLYTLLISCFFFK